MNAWTVRCSRSGSFYAAVLFCLGSLICPVSAQNAPADAFSSAQLNAIAELENSVFTESQEATADRLAMNREVFAVPADASAIAVASRRLAAAEEALAQARADAFAELQGTSNRLNTAQVGQLAATIGRGGRAGTATTSPMDLGAHAGWESLFDGTLSNWDGDPDKWRVADGAITADTTVTPGSTFLIWKGTPLRDFELKLEARLTGPSPGSGIMYRSVQAPRPTDAWYLNGYQFDLGARNAGQVVDQGGRLIIAYPGETTHAVAGGVRTRIADLGGSFAIEQYRPGEWNQVHLIAKGNTLIHILNGHIISITVDDDPARMMEGTIALQVEGMGRVEFRDIWLKRY